MKRLISLALALCLALTLAGRNVSAPSAMLQAYHRE